MGAAAGAVGLSAFGNLELSGRHSAATSQISVIVVFMTALESMVSLSGVPATATSPRRTASPAATSLYLGLFADKDDLEADLLKCKLVTRASEELHCPLRRLMGCTQFDADRLPDEVGKVFLHLPVKDEGNIGVELFLKLKEL